MGKRKQSDWLTLVKKTLSENPGKSLTQVLPEAKAAYKKLKEAPEAAVGIFGIKVRKSPSKKSHHKKSHHKKSHHKKSHHKKSHKGGNKSHKNKSRRK